MYNDIIKDFDIIEVRDGDTFIISIHNIPKVFGKKIAVRIRGIDTPEKNDKREHIKKIAYIALLANIVVQLWVIIKEEMIETLPNVYGYQGFNFSSLKETAEVAYKVVFVSLYVEVMAIILTYITNYAFEQDVIEAENLDYDELKKQADSVAKYQIENIYSPKPEEVLPDRSVSEKTGLMNISNQLGADSTVGQVSGSSNLSSSFVDKSIPVSSGPIINSNLTSNSSLSSNYPSQDNSNVVNNQKPEEPQQNKFLN